MAKILIKLALVLYGVMIVCFLCLFLIKNTQNTLKTKLVQCEVELNKTQINKKEKQ